MPASAPGSRDRVIDEPGDLVPAVLAAIDARDAKAFAAARAAVEEREQESARVRRRDELMDRLASQTPEPTLTQLAADGPWADRLARYGAAFWWAKAEAWLHDMLDASSGGAVSRVAVLNDEIRGLTGSIGEHLAWRNCLTALTLAQRMHLTLYQKAMEKYGQGKGKYAATYLADAQRELEQCRAAVPAWIMPTYRVAESLSPDRDAFDVVIVDEASQSGVDALFLWWLGKKVVIVGDDEQISPDAVGLELAPVLAIKKELLGDQPIGSVIGPTTSLFDLGDIAFTGNRTYLREHFRCMPEIIAFSNRISYADSPLEPLRQFGADRLPPLRSSHVAGATRSVGVRGQPQPRRGARDGGGDRRLHRRSCSTRTGRWASSASLASTRPDTSSACSWSGSGPMRCSAAGSSAATPMPSRATSAT